MKYIDEYRNRKLVEKLSAMITGEASKQYAFMEVCGGHTASIRRFGIDHLLPGNLKLISGPGCPVCVTSTEYIDRTMALSAFEGVTIVTFGDLMRVPGSDGSLETMKASGADIRVVFSALDALEIARREPERNVIFLAIGFETTAPGTAATIIQAEKEGINNFFVLSAHKVMPPAMELILKEGTGIDGFICPGHVATVTGSDAFTFIPQKFKTGCVVTGFEPVDILMAILMLVRQVNEVNPKVEIQYARAVRKEGNMTALGFMTEVFDHCDTYWRGLGKVAMSGLQLRKKYRNYDACEVFRVSVTGHGENELCRCGDILRGRISPEDCPLFATECEPAKPVGACMVSSEGACNVFYRYRKDE